MPEDHDTNPPPEEFHYKGIPVAKPGRPKRGWLRARCIAPCIRARLRWRRLKRELAHCAKVCLAFFEEYVLPQVEEVIDYEIKRRKWEAEKTFAEAEKTLAEANKIQTEDAILQQELTELIGKPQIGDPVQIEAALRLAISRSKCVIRKNGDVQLIRVQVELWLEQSGCDLSANPVIRELFQELLEITVANSPSPRHVLPRALRRQHDRIPLPCTVLVSRSQTLGSDLTLCRDISRSGLFAILSAASRVGYEVGQEAKLEFTPLDRSSPLPFALRTPRHGTIVRIDRSDNTSTETNSIGLGIEFDTPLNQPIHAS